MLTTFILIVALLAVIYVPTLGSTRFPAGTLNLGDEYVAFGLPSDPKSIYFNEYVYAGVYGSDYNYGIHGGMEIQQCCSQGFIYVGLDRGGLGYIGSTTITPSYALYATDNSKRQIVNVIDGSVEVYAEIKFDENGFTTWFITAHNPTNAVVPSIQFTDQFYTGNNYYRAFWKDLTGTIGTAYQSTYNFITTVDGTYLMDITSAGENLGKRHFDSDPTSSAIPNYHFGSYYIDIQPGDSISFLWFNRVVNSGSWTQTQLDNFGKSLFASGFDLYNGQKSLSVPLFSHLSKAELLRVVNWDFSFLAAGTGGDPHGIDLQGNYFDIPSQQSGFYSLFHNDLYQVNIKIESQFITEILVIFPAFDINLYCRSDDSGNAGYFLNDIVISIPESILDGLITTESGQFPVSGPLGELSQYHQSKLRIGNYITIVGGKMEGINLIFFNVVVSHGSESISEHPSILKLQNNKQRDETVDFSSAKIPDLNHTF